ncbi:MAG: alpha/beta fold hydrolase [Leifsonia sp.]
MRPTIIVPGIDGSGDAHWQTLWELDDPEALRIAPTSWSEPELEDWLAAIDDAVERQGRDAVIVAHSMGCLGVVEWLLRNPGGVAGVVLVAPADEAGPAFERVPSFVGIGRGATGVPSVLVASEDDPFCDAARVRELAERWGATLVSIGDAGHINAASGLGRWPEGRAILEEFSESLAAAASRAG